MKLWKRLCFTVLASLLGTTLAVAQGTQTGELRGTAVDTQGGVLPGVVVTASSPSLQGVRTTTTDENGIYLLRGLFNIYSLGMDSLAAKLRAQGYAPTVTTWDSAPAIAEQIISRHQRGDARPLVLIGHSLGSNAVIQIANLLA